MRACSEGDRRRGSDAHRCCGLFLRVGRGQLVCCWVWGSCTAVYSGSANAPERVILVFYSPRFVLCSAHLQTLAGGGEAALHHPVSPSLSNPVPDSTKVPCLFREMRVDPTTIRFGDFVRDATPCLASPVLSTSQQSSKVTTKLKGAKDIQGIRSQAHHLATLPCLHSVSILRRT